MRALYVFAGLSSLILSIIGAVTLQDAHGVHLVAHGAFTLLSAGLAASIGTRVLRHRGIPPALAHAFFEDPAGWKIVPVGDPQSVARFEVVRARS